MKLKCLIIEDIKIHAETIIDVIQEKPYSDLIEPISFGKNLYFDDFFDAQDFIRDNKFNIDIAFVDIKINGSGRNTGIDLITYLSINTHVVIYTANLDEYNIRESLPNRKLENTYVIDKSKSNTKEKLNIYIQKITNRLKIENRELICKWTTSFLDNKTVKYRDILFLGTLNSFIKTFNLTPNNIQDLLKTSYRQSGNNIRYVLLTSENKLYITLQNGGNVLTTPDHIFDNGMLFEKATGMIINKDYLKNNKFYSSHDLNLTIYGQYHEDGINFTYTSNLKF